MKIIFIILPLIFISSLQAQSDSVLIDNTGLNYFFNVFTIVSFRENKDLLTAPYSIVYSGKDKIQDGEAGISLDEISNDAAGVIVNNRHNFSLGDKITIRGIGARSSFGVRGIKIIYDGIPLTLPDGQTQLNNIDLSSAGRIEILKGPASSLYGNSAGGVINIQTEDPSSKLLSVSPQFIAGSFGLQKYTAKISGTSGDNSYLLNFNKLNYKGYREHSSSEFININSVINSILSDKAFLKTVINYYTSPYLLNPGSLDRTDADNIPSTSRATIKQQGAGEKSSQLQAGATLTWIKDIYNFETTLYYSKRSLLNPIPGRIIELNRSAGGIRSVFLTKIYAPFADINLQVGSDFEFQFDKRNESENLGLADINTKPEDIFRNIQYGNKLIDQDENVFNAGPFISSEFIFSPEVRLTTGLRFDYYEFKVKDKYLSDLTDDSGLRVMKNFNPMVGFVYNPSNNIKLYANYSTSFLTPTTSELSNLLDKEGGFNHGLNPEKIYNYETGAYVLLNNLSLSGAIYYMSLTNMLVPYQVENSEETFFRNAGKARNFGGEFTSEYTFNDNLKASINYSYMNFIFTDYVYTFPKSYTQLKNNRVPGIPDNKIGLSVFYGYSDFYSKLNLSWSDKYFTSDYNDGIFGADINNYINKSYTEVNIRMGYNINLSFSDIELFGGVNNLLDSKYSASTVPNAFGDRFFEPSPPRNWYVGIKLKD